MEQKQSDGTRSTLNSLSSHNRRGGAILATFLASLLALTCSTARAEVLVYEGFHPADYNNVGDNTQMTPSAAKVTGDYTHGLVTGAWQMNGAQPKVYGTNRGLSLPSDMTGAGYSALGGSIGLNPGENSSALRTTSHGLIDGTLNVSSGTLYVRLLLNLDSKAAAKLVAGSALAQKDGGYFGFGLTTGTTEYDLLTNKRSSLAFVVWKNSSNQYVLSLAHTTASGTAFTSYPLVASITLGTTYICYAEVQIGAGEDGKEIIRAGAMAVDDFTTDTPWAMLGGETDSVEVELMTASVYPTRIAVAGPYGTNSGYFRADEFVVGTKLSDILLASTTEPKLLNASLALANGIYTASASLVQSDATVSYVLFDGTTATTNAIAAYSDGDTVSGTFSAPTDGKTYEVRLLAENQGGETAEPSLGTIYGGALALGATTDANESGLVAGGVTVSRAAADPLPLTVNYTITGSAGAEGTTWAAPVAVTIPAGETSAVLPVVPLMDAAVTEDVTITVALADGNYELPASNAATLTLVNLVVPVGYNTWVAVADGLASVGSNWSEGRAPTSTDSVLFDGRFSTANCEWDAAATATVASWTQENGYTGTVMVDTVFPEKGGFTVLTVTGDMAVSSGSVTHKAHNATNKEDYYRLRIDIGGNLTVATGAQIHATGKGAYGAHSGTGSCAYGGSYNGSASWGSLTEPYGVGSSPTADGTYNAPAGGAIWMEVAGATTLDGGIRADSVSALGQWNGYSGSGGAVYLKTATLSGSGRISADCTNTSSGSNQDTGAGGRVSVLLTGGELSAFPNANLSALGGKSSYAKVGGVGTVLVRSPLKPNGILYLRDRSDKYSMYSYRPKPNQLTRIPAGQTWVLDEIVFGDNAILEVPTGTTLDLRGGLASISSTAAAIDETGLLVDGGTLLLPQAATHTISGKWIFEPQDFALDGNLVVTNGAGVGTLLLYSDTSNNVRRCGLSVSGDAHVASGAYLRAVRGGYIATGDATVGGTVAGCHGGQNAASTLNRVYDSVFHPRHPGAFGADVGRVNVGGGAVRLTVGGTLTLDGVAIATPNVAENRCGGGGAFDITAARLEGAGRIEANGNSRNYQAADTSKAGAGGRIAVKLTDASAAFSSEWIAKINAKGYYSSKITAAHSSSAGTVYLQTGAQADGAGTIIVRNTGEAANNVAFTPLPSTTAGGEEDDFRKASLGLEAAARVKLFEDLRMASLDMASGTVLDLNGQTLTVSRATVGGVKLAPGTYAAGDEAVSGFVADSGEGGELVVTGIGLSIIIR